MVQVQPQSKQRRTRYALGRTLDAGTEWIGVIKGAQNALQATLVAQERLGDPDVSAAPWKRLPAALKVVLMLPISETRRSSKVPLTEIVWRCRPVKVSA